MKQMQKLTCLLLALLMVLSLGITAFAAGTTPDPSTQQDLGTGTITVQSVKKGETYRLFKIASLEGYNKEKQNYSYKATPAFIDILKTNTDIQALLDVSDDGYITWKNPNDVSYSEGAKLAKPLMEFIRAKDIEGNPIATAVDPVTTTDTSDIVWENLEPGYYLVDTTTGSLCALDTTDMTATVQDKNIKPTNTKTTTEDGTDKQYSDAGIGRSVSFKSTITAHPGTENFIFHDKMSPGLTFNGDAVVTVTVPVAGENNTPLAENPVDPFTKYTVVTPVTDCSMGCTFHIVFSREFCDAITIPETIITVTYSATLNKEAVVDKLIKKADGTPDYEAMTGNTNEAKVSFGDDNEFSTGGKTKTFTYEVPIMKYTGSTDDPTALAGAHFELYGLVDKSVPIYFKDMGIQNLNGVNGVQVYKRIPHKAGDPKPTDAAEIITPESGKILLQGLDAVPYYLFETVPPTGYNLMSGSTTINISHGGVLQQNTAPATTIMVLNNTGNRLPATGGIGTTIFYVVGSLLLVGAGVLLVTKKRMSAEA